MKTTEELKRTFTERLAIDGDFNAAFDYVVKIAYQQGKYDSMVQKGDKIEKKEPVAILTSGHLGAG